MNLYFSPFDSLDSSQLSTFAIPSKVTHLFFDKCTIQADCEATIVDAVAKMSSLVCCIIHPVRLEKKFVDSILKALNCVGASLTHLVFHDVSPNMDLETFLRQNTSLKTMQIVDSTRNESGLMRLVSAMMAHPRLQLFTLKRCHRLDKRELDKNYRANYCHNALQSRGWLRPMMSFCFRKQFYQMCSDYYSTYEDVTTKNFSRFFGSVALSRNENDNSTVAAFVSTQQRTITLGDWSALFSAQTQKIHVLCRDPEESNYSLINLPKALASFSGIVALDTIEFDGPFSSLNAGVNNDVAVLLAQCKNLVDICVRNRAFNNKQTLELLTLLNQSERKNMRRLVIKANNFVIGQAIVDECTKLLKNNGNFKVLRLSRNRTSGLRPVGLNLLTNVIATHQSIESITINNVCFYSNMTDFLIFMMRQNQSLRKLKIRSDSYTSVETQHQLIRALVETNRLVSFHVMAFEQNLICCHKRDSENSNPEILRSKLESMREHMKGNASLLKSDLPETFPTLHRNAKLQWPRQFCFIYNFTIAMAPLDLPPYILLEIIDYLVPLALVKKKSGEFVDLFHFKKITLIINLKKSIRQVLLLRGQQ